MRGNHTDNGYVQSRGPEVGAHLVGGNENKEAGIWPEQRAGERCRETVGR